MTTKTKLEQSYDNFENIVRRRLPNKFVSLEDWLFSKSNKLLYEINNPVRFTKRYARGTLIKVDFGVNIGSEFSQVHFAIVINKNDTKKSDTLVVIPLTSKLHRNTIPLGSVVVDEVVKKIELELNKINEEILSSEFSKEKIIKDETLIKKISKIRSLINYYKNCSEMSYALLDQIRVISKLRICKPINDYDIIGKYKFNSEIMKKIDEKFMSLYTNQKEDLT